MYSLQETFDIVVAHLRKQGKRAYSDGGLGNGCCYRIQEPDGNILKCAAGCLIPDEKYNGDLEGMGLFDVDNWRDPLSLSSVGQLIKELGHDVKLVNILQNVHDGHFDELESALENVAGKFELIYTPPSTI